MLTESFQSIATAARRLFQNWKALIVLAFLYAGLLVSLYLFVTTREATSGQVALTLLLTIVSPFLFFLIQTAGACQVRALGPIDLLKESLKSVWKVVTVSLPLIALTILVLYLLGKAQNYTGAATPDLSNLPYQVGPQNTDTRSLPSSTTLLTAIRYLFIGLALPILAVHLWIASTKDGLLSTIKRSRRIFVGAFAPNSVLIYITGFLAFGLLPYLILFKTMPANSVWLEFGLFVGRLAVVFVLTLVGWVVTMSALAESAHQFQAEPTSEPLQ